jgi:uncharacterized membrane protein YagU involved in acid resistance
LNIRAKGAVKVVGSGIVYAAVFVTIMKQGGFGNAAAGPFKLIAMGTPGAFALVGLFELFTGIAFSRAAEVWDSLKGWQRGVIGLSVVVFTFALLVGVIVVYGMLTG